MPKGHFKKGNKLGGRPKGAKNKTKNEVKEVLQDILEKNIDTVQTDLDSLEPKDRLKIMLELMSYIVPKMRSVEVDVDVQHRQLGLSEQEFLSLENHIIELNDNGDGQD